MFKSLDKKIKVLIGTVFIFGSAFGALVGFDLKDIGQEYNHIWVLSILALYAGVDMISKSLK